MAARRNVEFYSAARGFLEGRDMDQAQISAALQTDPANLCRQIEAAAACPWRAFLLGFRISEVHHKSLRQRERISSSAQANTTTTAARSR